jgi:hypothetical protein
VNNGLERNYPNNFLERQKKMMNTISQDSWSLVQDLSPGPPEFTVFVVVGSVRRIIPLYATKGLDVVLTYLFVVM